MAPASRMVTLDSDMFKCCREVKTLGWADDAKARSFLQRACDHVKPIMAKRKWAVPVVYEFYPSDPRLLGLNYNRGEWIKVRLRRPGNINSFYPFESILQTLLHELVHIVHGPHDASFYNLLDELVAEAEKLPPPSSGGVNSVGVGPGHRLDAARRAVPRRQAGAVAAAAAARRAQKHAIMGSGRLGGDEHGLSRVCDPREMALAAAERRRRDDVWCPSGSVAGAAANSFGRARGGGSSRAPRRRGCCDAEVVEVIEIEDEESAERLNRRSRSGKGGDVIVID